MKHILFSISSCILFLGANAHEHEEKNMKEYLEDKLTELSFYPKLFPQGKFPRDRYEFASLISLGKYLAYQDILYRYYDTLKPENVDDVPNGEEVRGVPSIWYVPVPSTNG
jgi:hypothetical protein